MQVGNKPLKLMRPALCLRTLNVLAQGLQAERYAQVDKICKSTL